MQSAPLPARPGSSRAERNPNPILALREPRALSLQTEKIAGRVRHDQRLDGSARLRGRRLGSSRPHDAGTAKALGTQRFFLPPRRTPSHHRWRHLSRSRRRQPFPNDAHHRRDRHRHGTGRGDGGGDDACAATENDGHGGEPSGDRVGGDVDFCARRCVTSSSSEVVEAETRTGYGATGYGTTGYGTSGVSLARGAAGRTID